MRDKTSRIPAGNVWNSCGKTTFRAGKRSDKSLPKPRRVHARPAVNGGRPPVNHVYCNLHCRPDYRFPLPHHTSQIAASTLPSPRLLFATTHVGRVNMCRELGRQTCGREEMLWGRVGAAKACAGAARKCSATPHVHGLLHVSRVRARKVWCRCMRCPGV